MSDSEQATAAEIREAVEVVAAALQRTWDAQCGDTKDYAGCETCRTYGAVIAAVKDAAPGPQ